MSETASAEIPRHIFDDDHLALKRSWSKLYEDGGDGRALFKRAGMEALLSPAGDLLERLLAEEAHGFAGGGAALVTNHAALDAVTRLGTAEQKAALTARLSSGDTIAALALLEHGAGGDVRAMTATAVASADGYVLSGAKIALASADLADLIVAVAITADGGFVFAVVEAKARGVSIRPLAEEALVAEITLSDVTISGDAVLGGKPVPVEEADRALALIQIAQSARAVARMDYALNLAVRGAKTREAGGRPIFKNQAVQFRLADQKAELMVARAFVDRTAEVAIKTGEITPLAAAMLKLFVSEAEEKLLDGCEQALGAVAYSDDFPLARLHAAARAEQLASGARESLRTRIFKDGSSQDRSDTFDILVVGRDDSVLTEDYALFRDSVRRFLKKEVEPYAKDWADSGNIPKDIWKKGVEAGVLGAGVPLESGGGGGGELHYLVFAEEMGRSPASGIVGPLFQSDGLVDLVTKFGSEALKEEYYGRYLEGQVPALAMSEPQSASDVRAFRTFAVRDGDEWVINGQKLWISFATHADFFFILAKTDPDNPAAMSFFAADAKTPGIEPRRLKTRIFPCGDTCEVFLTDVRIPLGNLVGAEGAALAMTKEVLVVDRITQGARSLGSADLAYRQTLDFVATRRVFGKNLVDYENTQSLLAQVRTELHAAQAFIDYAFQRHARGTLDFPTASVAKLWHPNFEFRTVDKLMQMFGGNGFVADYPISYQLGGSRATRILGGTDEMMRQTISYGL